MNERRHPRGDAGALRSERVDYIHRLMSRRPSVPRPSSPSAMASWLSSVVPVLGTWTLLDVLVNLRYPAPGPSAYALLPSLDVTVLLAGFAWCGADRRRIPRVVPWVLAVAVVIIRLFRFGDGVSLRYFNRALDLPLDLPLSSELVRLLDSTTSRVILVPGLLIAIGALLGLVRLTSFAWQHLARGLAAPAPRAFYLAVVAVSAALSLVLPTPPAGGDDSTLRQGAFAPSVLPRAAAELAAWRDLPLAEAAATATIGAVDRQLRLAPHDLAALRGSNVFVFLVESYGRAVFARPELRREVAPTLAALEQSLRRASFAVASRFLASPTYAGRSWLAQETLATGVAVTDRVVDAAVQARRPTTMARLFTEAGYRTVLVQPGSTHPTLHRWAYDFERVYSAWDLGYAGPSFRWSPMPDQYVIAFAHRHEVVPAATARPLFIEFALTSSHAPWSDQPPFVVDWPSLGDGSIYRTLTAAHFPVTWLNLAEGGEAYGHSVAMDLQVVGDYLTRFMNDDALVLILGDHQPVAEITRFSKSRDVPVHVVSRNHAIIDAFLARGYQRGLWPREGDDVSPGLDTMLPALLTDLSAARPVDSAGMR